jgi:hypothetical protein
MADKPPRQARLLSFATGQPIDDPWILESLGMLSLLADRAMVAGADPSALVSPDHSLLLLCDYIVIAKRQHDQVQAAYRAIKRPLPPDDEKRIYDEWRRADRTVRSLLMKLRKYPATTAAGIFAKAAAVSRTGSAAAVVAVSLADDLLRSAELRRAVWPAAERRDADG